MKHIFFTLSLVIALSLCAVAFASETEKKEPVGWRAFPEQHDNIKKKENRAHVKKEPTEKPKESSNESPASQYNSIFPKTTDFKKDWRVF